MLTPARPFETERLILAPLRLDDAPGIQREFPHWEIVRWMDGVVPWPYPDDGALTYLTQIALPAAERGEAWHWSIRPKTEPDALIGVISLMTKDGDNRGFWLARAWQGQGLMTEAADVVTDFWFDDLDQTVLRAPKAAANDASRRVSIKQGMRCVATFPKAMVSGETPCELWEITREAWRSLRRRSGAVSAGGGG